jgi:hypothetical protein
MFRTELHALQYSEKLLSLQDYTLNTLISPRPPRLLAASLSCLVDDPPLFNRSSNELTHQAPVFLWKKQSEGNDQHKYKSLYCLQLEFMLHF